MKFGKDFKKQMVPEWSEAYLDYDGLKKLLKRISHLRPRKQHLETFYRSFSGLSFQARNLQSTVDIEDQVNAADIIQEPDSMAIHDRRLLGSTEAQAYETFFFQKLDNELKKVNTFYIDKVDEVMTEATVLTKQMDALIALRIKVKNPDFDGCNSLGQLLVSTPSPEASRVASPRRGVNAETKHMDFTHAEGLLPEGLPQSASITSTDGALREEVYEVVGEPAHLEVLDRVKIKSTYNNPISTIKGILKDTKEKKLQYKRDELKEVEARLKLVFVEFYRKLLRLKRYSFMNLLAVSKILKKYEKITSGNARQSYMKQVDNSYLGSCDEVTALLERVEATYIKHFSNSDRKEGMKLLRPKPKREKHRITFFSGFLSGCTIALLVALVLLIQTKNLLNREEATLYMDKIFPLYSLYVYIFLHTLLYTANIYFWRRYRINYPFIFGFKQGTELGYREVFLISTGLAVLVLGTFLVHLHIKMDSKTQDYETYIELVPLGLVIVILAITFCPLNIIYRSSRFFLIKCVFRCICAPLYKVVLPDFFVADQLTSQIQAIRCLEYYICYYGWEIASHGRNICHSHDVYNVFYYIEAIIPFWFRVLQCMRRLFEEKDLVHGYNGLRYFMTIIAIVIRTTYRVKQGITWQVLTIVSSGITTIASAYWDIVVDWGLLQRKSKNLFLRDKLVLHHKSIYFIAVVLDIILRFAWLQLVLDFDMRSLRGKAISSTISCLEILRRGMWNFFRIENEHLYNVGKYRAFKSVPLPFVYDDDHDKDE